ncbi:thermolabile L-asparaginase [Hypoxylon fragiforme]|uniref:thermolabile L-asparaginase n=1 Tax=Hypoxylon fragiforme TaxID=63214 RepID=UPI0020C6F520|nr:thermolabile L-asparaginase [Hypoxylon fragiforme]KAI2612327.1 thermolabile L-asparaginase [Hypoxylon fragiforme]
MDHPTPPLSTDFLYSTRGGIVENRHLVHAAVVSSSTPSTSPPLFSLGDPTRLTFLRSAAKPVQALPFVEANGLSRFGLDAADLALMCGTHNSEPAQVARARAMLVKVGVEESQLECGAHPAISPRVNKEWVESGFAPTPVCAACSANHVGVMAGARAVGAGVAGYHLAGHPVQDRIGEAVQELTGLAAAEIGWALDGCNMVSPATPLQAVARIFAAFAQAADDGEKEDEDKDKDKDEDKDKSVPLSSPRTQAMARIYRAIAAHPENIGGSNRFCTELIAAHGGALIGKAGGDGCYAIGVRASEDTRRLGAQGAIGIALKIEDGNFGAMEATAAELLEQLGIGTPEARGRLEGFRRGEIKNSRGVVTGGLTFAFKLRAA